METLLRHRLDTQRAGKRKRDELSQVISILSDFPIADLPSIENEGHISLVLRSKYNDTTLAVMSYIARHIPVIMPAQDRGDIIASVVDSIPTLEMPEAIQLESMLRELSDVPFFGDQDIVNNILSKCKMPIFCVLTPPYESCLSCGRRLVFSSSPCHITLFSLEGPKPGIKVTWKCKNCRINYGYAQYGNASTGYRFYEKERSLVEVSNVTYLERNLCLSQIFLA